jgi:hypothetical protein
MDPDPTSDTTPFFSDFKDAKEIIFFFIFFSYNLPTGTLSSFLKITIFCYNFVLKFYLARMISVLTQDIYEKRVGSGFE